MFNRLQQDLLCRSDKGREGVAIFRVCVARWSAPQFRGKRRGDLDESKKCSELFIIRLTIYWVAFDSFGSFNKGRELEKKIVFIHCVSYPESPAVLSLTRCHHRTGAATAGGAAALSGGFFGAAAWPATLLKRVGELLQGDRSAVGLRQFGR